ncbi:T9SS type A sorting domain-containing protein [bacterium SCSIO 12741]|nr:T9SS type A sorting domain-containing protein [bacterium SCSIO 12741]
MKFRNLYIGLLIMLCSSVAFGQIEEVHTLPAAAFEHPTQQKAERGDGSRADDVVIHHLLDTLSLPLFDDFVDYKIKIFTHDTNDPSVFDSASYHFSADGQFPDTLEFRTSAVFNYVEDPINGGFDTIRVDSFLVQVYDSLEPFKVKKEFYVFPSYSLHTQNGITRKLPLTPDSTMYNFKLRHYFSKDDGSSYWIAGSVRWNQTLCDRSPSLGVVSFDGLDSLNWPYDNSEDYTYGIADRFTSKPINLFDHLVGSTLVPYLPGDSIGLSFFVQPEGLADQPEKEDSLVLQFYSPVTNRWSTVWSREGDTNQAFQKVLIHIDEAKYLQKGFRFRFQNFATLSGNFDHWHLDYIEMGSGKSVNDTIIDFAIAMPLRTTLKEYTAMPWLHYKTNPSEFCGDSINLVMNNLSQTTDECRALFRVYKAGNVNPHYTSKTYQNTFVPANSFYPMDMPFNAFDEYFTFPVDQEERQWFRVYCQANASSDVFRKENNHLELSQIFDRYYAYDDWSAEQTYHLNLVGTQVAVEFETPIEDTLKAIYINFVETFSPTLNHRVNLKVFRDLNSGPVYESGSIDVINTPAGTFHRYTIPQGVVVDGKFYIGWEQISNYKTYVGYDNSYNNEKRTFISEFDGEWKNTSYKGTIMIRADFGNGDETPLSNQTIMPEYSGLSIYPNPARDWLQLDGLESGESAQVQLYNLQGKEVHYQRTDGEPVSLPNLPNGFYVVRVQRDGHPDFTGKLVISK